MYGGANPLALDPLGPIGIGPVADVYPSVGPSGARPSLSHPHTRKA